MAITTKLDMDDQGKCVDIKIYRGMFVRYHTLFNGK